MPTLEIRRHSHRKAGGGSQLSQHGVDVARRLGERLGRFDYVATSVVPRARETAIAMGYAVDQEVVTLCVDEEVHAEMQDSLWWTKSSPMSELAELARTRGAVWRYGSSLVAIWRDLLTPLRPEQSVLLISHSGELELGLACCFPAADHSAWNPVFGPLEGARLTFDGDPAAFTGLTLIREAQLQSSTQDREPDAHAR
jgi:broad specificity phosphatase PhoE